MRLTRPKLPFEKVYYLVDCKLNKLTTEKFLGILGANNLNWSENTDFIASKSHRMLNLLHRTCNTQVKKLRKVYIYQGLDLNLNIVAQFGLLTPREILEC